MKKIKVLYVHHAESEAGAPRSLAFLIDNLDKDKYEPYVLISFDYEGNKKLFEGVGAKVIYKPLMGPWHGSTVSGMSLGMLYFNLKHAIPTYYKMFDVLKEVKPDLVHLNSTCLFIVAKAVKKSDSNIPVVCHVREPLLPNYWGDILRRNIEKYVDYFVAIEKYDINSLKTNKRYEVINNFVDFNVYNSKVKSSILHEELHIDEKHKILLYLARISPENGALEMIKAIEDLLKKRKDIHLCLVGARLQCRTEYQDKVMKISEKYENIHILSFRKDIPEIIASSDVLITPFKEPHFARSIIEAAAMGVPAIGSDIGGIQELIINNKTGYLIENNDNNALKEKCEFLVDNDGVRRKFGQNAEEYAKENFEAIKNSKRTFEIYDKLLNK